MLYEPGGMLVPLPLSSGSSSRVAALSPVHLQLLHACPTARRTGLPPRSCTAAAAAARVQGTTCFTGS